MTEDHDLDEYVRVAEFRSALRRFLRRSERYSRAHGLTPQRYLLLLMIKGAPGRDQRATVSDLAKRLQLAQSTVTELVGRAEHAGLLSREGSTEDARVAYLRLTEEGEARLARAFESLADERDRLRAALLELQKTA